MSLIKTRPTISLLLPAQVVAGDRVTAQVRLDQRRPVEVEDVTCILTGTERVASGAGNSRRSANVTVLSLGASLRSEGTLPAGRSELSCVFELPADLPPSYRAVTGATTTVVEYVVSVRCSIPWWPDASRDFVLSLRRPPAEAPDRSATLHTTSTSGPRGKEPHMEFSLSSRSLAPGEVLEGELALSNVAHNRYRMAVLSLVGMGTLRNTSGRQMARVEQHRYRLRADLSAAAEGEPISFAMRLPQDLPPSHKSQLWELAWFFDVELDIAWSKNLVAQVPLTVLPTGSLRKQRTRRAVPTIGSERVLAIWRQVAERHGFTFEVDAQRMVARVDEVEVSISRSHRGGDGIFLVGELRYPDLGLDIDGGLEGGLRRMLGGGVELGVKDWDKQHYVTGRELDQVAGFVASLAPLLARQRLGDIDDRAMSLEVRDAGQSRKVLSELAETAMALARALPPAWAAIPPPACMQQGLPTWQRLARRLGGELSTAAMVVKGQQDGFSVRVATGWSPRGQPVHTELSLHAPELVREGDELRWSQDGFSEGDPERLPKPARSLLQRMTERALALTVTRENISVLDERAPILDEATLWQRVESLVALAAALRQGRGPYR